MIISLEAAENWKCDLTLNADILLNIKDAEKGTLILDERFTGGG